MADRPALLGGTPVHAASFPAWPQWDERERSALLGVLDSGQWWATGGAQVPRFEAAWAAHCDAAQCVAVTNGTHAIEVALAALGIGAGDEVIVADYSFFASASAVVSVGATPVLVDVERDTFCIDPDAVAAAIGPRTRAVIAVHIAGHPCDFDRLVPLCAAHSLALIEDCAHAHGSRWRDRAVGSFGAVSTFSFQQSKLLTAGEGGAITSRDAEVGAALRSFADCGRRPGEWFYRHFVLGGNYRMTEWQAAILLGQLQRFPEQHQRRNRNALALDAALATIPGVHPQRRDPRTTAQGYYCYVVRLDEAVFGVPRELVRLALEAEGIPMTMSYPAIHGLDAFVDPAGFAPRHRDHYDRGPITAQRPTVSAELAATTLWCRHSLLLGEQDDALALARALQRLYAHRDALRQWR